MEFAYIVYVLVSVTALSYFVVKLLVRDTNRIPSPPLSDYLPSGKIYRALLDYREFGRVLHTLSGEYGDLFSVRLGFKPMLVTSNPEDIAQIITHTRDFPRELGLEKLFKTVFPGGLFAMDETTHATARRILRENFSQKMLQSFQKEMTKAINELCESCEGASKNKGDDGLPQVVDLSEMLYVTTFRVITNVALGSGMDKKERLRFNSLTNEFMEELMKEFMYHPVKQWLSPFGTRKRFFETLEEVREMCRVFILKRMKESVSEKQNRQPDALDTILTLDEANITTISSLAIEFALAGAVTTAQAIVWCLYEVCQDENVRKCIEKEVDDVIKGKACDDPISLEDMEKLSYINMVWKETLRLRSLNVGFSRVTSREVTLKGSGVKLKKGAYVYAFASRVQRDPAFWTDPLKFKPERWGSGGDKKEGDRVPMGAYVPFSMGRRSCVGKFLADYEGPLIVAELLRRFRFKLGCGAEEIISCTCIVETARWFRKDGSEAGVPVMVEIRERD